MATDAPPVPATNEAPAAVPAETLAAAIAEIPVSPPTETKGRFPTNDERRNVLERAFETRKALSKGTTRELAVSDQPTAQVDTPAEKVDTESQQTPPEASAAPIAQTAPADATEVTRTTPEATV